MTHRSCCDVLLPQLRCTPATSNWLTRDNSLLQDPSSMCLNCFLHPSEDENDVLTESAVLSRKSLFIYIKHATLLGLCSLVHCTLSELDCEAVWTRDEFLADCSLSCRRKIYNLTVALSISSTHALFDLNVLLC